jgi:hypothetical protein
MVTLDAALIERYEKEILEPMVMSCEQEKARKRTGEQAEINSIVERILQSVGD